MARTTATVLCSGVLGIVTIVIVGMCTGHNGNLATGGLSALALVMGGSGMHAWEKRRRR